MEMKKSGIEWIGDIPSTWKIVRGKKLYKIDTGKLDVNAENPHGKYPFFTCSMYPKKIDEYAFDCEALLVAGNGIVGYTQYYCGKFNAYQRTYVLSEIENINPIFLKYYMSNNLITEVAPNSVGSVIQFIKLSDLQNFNVCVPPINEQNRIVDFLNKQIPKIEDAIEKTRDIIKEYNDYKQSLIYKYITGVNHIEKEQCDLGWITEKYKNWSITKLSNIFEQVKNKNTGLIETNLLSLSYGKIKQKNINSNEGLLPENFEGYNIINNNDIVLRLTDLQNDHKSLRVGIARQKGIITSAYVTLRNKLFNDSRYFYYYLHSFDICKGFYGMGSGVRQGLTFGEIKNFPLLIPSIEEQKEIADFLDEKCNIIDELISEKEKLIKQLEQYKKSVIYEYVTGKKEVK